MKTLLTLGYSCLLLALPLGALGDDAKALADSLAKWEEAKKACGGNYQYKVSFSSFTGAGNVTEIVVRNNEVTERRYREFGGPPIAPVAPGNVNPESDKPKWIEKGDDIGKNSQGAPAKTLDELYAEAKDVAAKELPEFEKRYLRFDEAGLLKSCFVIDTRIADDAPRKGVAISGLELQKAGEGKPDAKVYKSPNGKAYPAHWGAPPRIQTRDYRPLPGGYGNGSGTLAKWIAENLKKDAE